MQEATTVSPVVLRPQQRVPGRRGLVRAGVAALAALVVWGGFAWQRQARQQEREALLELVAADSRRVTAITDAIAALQNASSAADSQAASLRQYAWEVRSRMGAGDTESLDRRTRELEQDNEQRWAHVHQLRRQLAFLNYELSRARAELAGTPGS